MTLKRLKQAWHLHRFWDKPELKLKRQLKYNPLYPFQETDNEYVLETRNSDLYVGLIVLVASAIGGGIYWYQMKTFSNELFDTAFILMFLWSIRLISFNWQKRRIVLEKDGQNYFFYVGGRLVYEGEIHNIYFRLRSQCSSNGSTYYRLVLNGFHVEEQELSSMTTNKAALELLAKRIAFKTNVNYFDSDDVSIRTLYTNGNRKNTAKRHSTKYSITHSHIVRHVNPKTFYLKPKSKRPAMRSNKRMSVTRATLEAFY